MLLAEVLHSLLVLLSHLLLDLLHLILVFLDLNDNLLMMGLSLLQSTLKLSKLPFSLLYAFIHPVELISANLKLLLRLDKLFLGHSFIMSLLVQLILPLISLTLQLGDLFLKFENVALNLLPSKSQGG